MLVAWLFGLAAGIVNACVVGEPTRSTSAPGQHEEHASLHDGRSSGESAHENCLHFCGKSAIGVPKVKLTGDGSTDASFAAIASGYPVIAAAERTGIVLPALTPYWRGSPPLRIAYHRLAL